VHDVVAGDLAAAAIGARQRRQDLDRRGLPCAVRAEQREDLAGAHAEGHPGERLHVPVALLEPLRDQRVHGG
jgi:hypothetical protein